MEYRIPGPLIEFAPRVYPCRRATEPPLLDGNLDKDFWRHAPWTDAFVDIIGETGPAPRCMTRAKMLWDDACIYFGAELWGDEIWAGVTRRDDVIFRDNDFEIFIDPDSDTHAYCEFEMNALGTVWDLFMTKPYRDGGIPINSFDIKGLRSAVRVDGTLNVPSAANVKWSVEIAMPFESLLECVGQGARPPSQGDFWRVNFSRVQWRVDTDGGAYHKKTDPQTGAPLPEDNWVWSPIGRVNMHYPEMWGYVFFIDGGEERCVVPEDERRKWALRQHYYRQHRHYDETGAFVAGPDPQDARIDVRACGDWFIASMPSADGKARLVIAADGRVTKVRRKTE